MTTAYMIWLAVLILVFIIWAFLMFRMLWRISQNAARARQPGDGPAARTSGRMSAFMDFFRAPSNRRLLLWLVGLSAVLMGMNIAAAYHWAPGS